MGVAIEEGVLAKTRLGTLSLNQASVASLLFSHVVACKALDRHVKKAMAAAFPESWKEKAGSCFTFRGRSRDRLITSFGMDSQITDLFVLCKIIRIFLRQAFFEEADGNMAAAYHRLEKLARAEDAVETVRHWIFHGESISVEEAMSGLTYTADLVEMICADGDSQDAVVNIHQMKTLLETFYHECAHAQRTEGLPLPVVVGTLVITCFDNLQKDLLTVFEDIGWSKMLSKEELAHSKRQGLAPLLELLCKRWDWNEMKSRRRRDVRICISVVCKGLISLRNDISHGHLPSLADRSIVQKLQLVVRLYNALSLDCDVAPSSTIGIISDLLDQVKPSGHCGSVTVTCSPTIVVECCAQTKTDFRRPLRSIDDVFVGRDKELDLCLNFLRDEHSSEFKQRGKLLVIEGVSGVGKSALARQILSWLQNSFKRQLWVCASTEEILASELVELFHLNRSRTRIRQPESSGLTSFNRHLRELQHHLIVLHDLHIDSSSFVAELLRGTNHSVIVTMCVFDRELLTDLANIYPSILHVHLDCLSISSSRQLLNKRSVKIPQDISTLEEVLKNDLECLPLVLNLFASTLKHHKRMYPGTSYETALLKLRPGLNKELIEEERRTTDRHFVKGLTGLIAIAIAHMQSCPHVFCLVAILALSGSPSGIPEKFFRKLPLFGSHTSSEAETKDREDHKPIFKVVGRLFGENSKLDASIISLLDLGLITFDRERSLLKMHQLFRYHIVHSNDHDIWGRVFGSSPVQAKEAIIDVLSQQVLNVMRINSWATENFYLMRFLSYIFLKGGQGSAQEECQIRLPMLIFLFIELENSLQLSKLEEGFLAKKLLKIVNADRSNKKHIQFVWAVERFACLTELVNACPENHRLLMGLPVLRSFLSKNEALVMMKERSLPPPFNIFTTLGSLHLVPTESFVSVQVSRFEGQANQCDIPVHDQPESKDSTSNQTWSFRKGDVMGCTVRNKQEMEDMLCKHASHSTARQAVQALNTSPEIDQLPAVLSILKTALDELMSAGEFNSVCTILLDLSMTGLAALQQGAFCLGETVQHNIHHICQLGATTSCAFGHFKAAEVWGLFAIDITDCSGDLRWRSIRSFYLMSSYIALQNGSLETALQSLENWLLHSAPWHSFVNYKTIDDFIDLFIEGHDGLQSIAFLFSFLDEEGYFGYLHGRLRVQALPTVSLAYTITRLIEVLCNRIKGYKQLKGVRQLCRLGFASYHRGWSCSRQVLLEIWEGLSKLFEQHHEFHEHPVLLPEAQALIAIAAHVLRSLAELHEVDEDISSALHFYNEVLGAQQRIYPSQHQLLKATECNIRRCQAKLVTLGKKPKQSF